MTGPPLQYLLNCKVFVMIYQNHLRTYAKHVTFSDQISALSKSSYSHIRQLRCIRPDHDLKTASTIAASIVHSKLDYCNSLYFNLPKSQINHLQLIQNNDCILVKVPNPVTSHLHCLKIHERTDYKLLSLSLLHTMFSQPLNPIIPA